MQNSVGAIKGETQPGEAGLFVRDEAWVDRWERDISEEKVWQQGKENGQTNKDVAALRMRQQRMEELE